MEIKDIDPYEYLFSRLKVKVKIVTVVTDYFNFECYKIFFRKKHVGTFVNHKMSDKKILFDYLTAPERSTDFWSKTNLQNLVNILKPFPTTLESQEHVDLLLTLNGMNKGA